MEAVVLVVGLVVLGVLLALAVRSARLAAQVRSLARDGAELSRTVAAVQGWAAKELRALRGEFTVSRVNDAAADIKERLKQKRADSVRPPLLPRLPEPSEEPEEPRDTIATPAPAMSCSTPSDDADATNILDLDPRASLSRLVLIRPPAPLAFPDLIGWEDIPEEAASSLLRLGPEDETPPRRGRAPVFLPAFRGPEEGGAA